MPENNRALTFRARRNAKRGQSRRSRFLKKSLRTFQEIEFTEDRPRFVVSHPFAKGANGWGTVSCPVGQRSRWRTDTSSRSEVTARYRFRRSGGWLILQF